MAVVSGYCDQWIPSPFTLQLANMGYVATYLCHCNHLQQGTAATLLYNPFLYNTQHMVSILILICVPFTGKTTFCGSQSRSESGLKVSCKRSLSQRVCVRIVDTCRQSLFARGSRSSWCALLSLRSLSVNTITAWNRSSETQCSEKWMVQWNPALSKGYVGESQGRGVVFS